MPGGSISPLLRSGDRHIYPPLVVPVIDAAERRDRVDQQQRRVADAVDRFADFGDPAGDPGGRFVVHHAQRFDRPSSVGRQPLRDYTGVYPMTPVAGNEVDHKPKVGRHLLPQCGEMPRLEG
jgi:hypothetical protein